MHSLRFFSHGLLLKLLDSTDKWILSSTAWSPVREGMQIRYHPDDKLQLRIFRQGTTSTGNFLNAKVETALSSYVGVWLHMAVVWVPGAPRFDVYYDGQSQVVTGNFWVTPDG